MELNYSKKQLAPLIKKYGIDVENDLTFAQIINEFEGQTNYHIWAIKSVYDKVTSLANIIEIHRWANEHQTEIQNLVKGNIVAYKTEKEFCQLDVEISGLSMLSFVNNAINVFNTEQKHILRSNILNGVNNGLKAHASSCLIEWYEIFNGVKTLAEHKQKKLISTASALTNFDAIKKHIVNALSATYEWVKEDFLGFISRNTSSKDLDIVYNEGPLVILRIKNFNTSEKLCGGGRTQWCITRELRYFNQYVKDADSTQYFLFDFSKRESHELAHVGFTVKPGYGITNAHSTTNRNMIGDGFCDESGQYCNIDDVLRNHSIPSSVYINLKNLVNYQWDIEKFLQYAEKNKNDMTVMVVKDNRVVIKVKNNKGLCSVIDHTLIDSRIMSLNNDSKSYFVLDFNKNNNDDTSLIGIHYAKDQYRIDSLDRVVDAFNRNITKSGYLEKIGIDTSEFVDRENVDPRILFHKFIDEKNESAALKLLESQGDKFDVNYEFDYKIPIFTAIQNRNLNLFSAIVNHPNFDPSVSDGFGEPLLQSLMYNYHVEGVTTREEDDMVIEMINCILNVENYDYNVSNINFDTAINVACEYPHFNWIVEKLVNNPSVNLNVVNDFNCTSLGNAIRHKNLEALKLIGKRVDLVVRDEDIELAKENGIDLSKFIDPQPISNVVYKYTSITEDEEKEKYKDLFEKAMKAIKELC